ncbi:MAG: methionyl-tRNA formyltransferase [Phycisphaerales bacterium]|nr:methionyl-tRNA formyltransferase [Phycisphaerales bacterium]
MRLAFFGSGAFGLPTLRALASQHEVTLVVSQPDRPAGRGGRLTPTPIAAWASEHASGTPLLRPERANDPAITAAIRGVEADAWVVIAFGQKLGRALLAEHFAINLHASLLPRWRGAAPINAAILAGDRVTGNSVITLAERMDAGLILGQSEREVAPESTAGDLHDLLAADGPDLVLRVLAEHEAGAVHPREQDESLVTLAPKLSRADAWADFARSADECRRRINGLSPWPGVQATLGGHTLKLLRVAPEAAQARATPGTLIDAAGGLIACGEGRLRLLEVQPSGRKPMPWADFVRGNPLPLGATCSAGEGPAPC